MLRLNINIKYYLIILLILFLFKILFCKCNGTVRDIVNYESYQVCQCPYIDGFDNFNDDTINSLIFRLNEIHDFTVNTDINLFDFILGNSQYEELGFSIINLSEGGNILFSQILNKLLTPKGISFVNNHTNEDSILEERYNSNDTSKNVFTGNYDTDDGYAILDFNDFLRTHDITIGNQYILLLKNKEDYIFYYSGHHFCFTYGNVMNNKINYPLFIGSKLFSKYNILERLYNTEILQDSNKFEIGDNISNSGSGLDGFISWNNDYVVDENNKRYLSGAEIDILFTIIDELCLSFYNFNQTEKNDILTNLNDPKSFCVWGGEKDWMNYPNIIFLRVDMSSYIYELILSNEFIIMDISSYNQKSDISPSHFHNEIYKKDAKMINLHTH